MSFILFLFFYHYLSHFLLFSHLEAWLAKIVWNLSVFIEIPFQHHKFFIWPLKSIMCSKIFNYILQNLIFVIVKKYILCFYRISSWKYIIMNLPQPYQFHPFGYLRVSDLIRYGINHFGAKSVRFGLSLFQNTATALSFSLFRRRLTDFCWSRSNGRPV